MDPKLISTDALLTFHQKMCADARAIMASKNADYTNRCQDGNPFSNFTRCEAMGICSTESGFLVRLTDKMSRLVTFAQGNNFKVLDESVTDTLLDTINYAILLAAYIKSQSEGDSSPQPKTLSDAEPIHMSVATTEEGR